MNMKQEFANMQSTKTNFPPESLRRLRGYVHSRMVDSFDSNTLFSLSDTTQLKEKFNEIIENLQRKYQFTISNEDRDKLEQETLEELGGMGPLAPLMLDNDISDILVNGPKDIWIDRHGRLEKTGVEFDDADHIRRFLDRIISQQGRHLDASSPMVDAKLPDGSRLHAVIPPLIADGAVISIRRFRADDVGPEALVRSGFMSQTILETLQLAVKAGINIVVAGSAAAGKTTLLNALSHSIPSAQRVVTIEETSELRLSHPHIVSLESRPINMEGRGGVSLRELVRNALRMRADRIIVGEVRGGEVMDMLQAMNVGHEGSLTTVHANSIHDVLRRLEALALMSDVDIPRESVREMIASAIQLVVHATRFQDGSRRITSVGEVVFDGEKLSVVPIFDFELTRNQQDDSISGHHIYTGHRPNFLRKIQLRGYDIPLNFNEGDDCGAG